IFRGFFPAGRISGFASWFMVFQPILIQAVDLFIFYLVHSFLNHPGGKFLLSGFSQLLYYPLMDGEIHGIAPFRLSKRPPTQFAELVGSFLPLHVLFRLWRLRLLWQLNILRRLLPAGRLHCWFLLLG